MPGMRSFASDNNAGAHPDILRAVAAANEGHAIAYGDDPWTRRAEVKFREHFGDGIAVFFVYGGTGANVVSLRAAARSHHAVLCSDVSHINNDECGAPEAVGRFKLLAAPTPDGKLTPELLRPFLHALGDQHHSQPRALSITQATEMGTVYAPEEVRALAAFAHDHGLVLHMDGARLANAAASLKLPLRAVTRDCGVDLLSFGGCKNGLLFGEAIVVFEPALAGDLKFIRKQGMQLPSKVRFIAAQYEALLTDDLWLRNAIHANRMAKRLASKVKDIPGVEITQRVEANGIFARIPAAAIPVLQEKYFFYVWDEETAEVRWMCSFDTTEEDVERFAEAVREVIGAGTGGGR
jgi:threonine aldolase